MLLSLSLKVLGMKPISVWPVVVALSFSLNVFARAETAIPSMLECSALTKSPESQKRFVVDIVFSLENNSLRGERSTGRRPGRELYSGLIGPDKTIKVTGRGAYFNNVGSGWRSQFSGAIKDGDLTVLKGSLDANKGGGHRDCMITFLLPSEKLAAALDSSRTPAVSAHADRTKIPAQSPNGSPRRADATSTPDEQTRKQLADMVRDLAEKQKALQVAQDDLKKQQADAVRDLADKQKALQASQAAGAASLNEKQKALQAEQDKVALAAKELNARQAGLEAGQSSLKREQIKASENVNFVQKLLDGIILPTTEDPNSWVLRVAAVPVQQQQFCRIIDKFYDNIGTIYQAHNDIKKNSLFRDRQLSMAALLPQGAFSNWVVRVKEVTQAADGSAAVMLQPPCRAMLGSDACQMNGSKIQATISPSSPVYRELGQVNAGDFVVVSGRILYAEDSGEKPLPTYAVYQAGSHCSGADGSKQEDVFVTEINYLVQLR
jgi:hypothetical protein